MVNQYNVLSLSFFRPYGMLLSTHTNANKYGKLSIGINSIVRCNLEIGTSIHDKYFLPTTTYSGMNVSPTSHDSSHFRHKLLHIVPSVLFCLSPRPPLPCQERPSTMPRKTRASATTQPPHSLRPRLTAAQHNGNATNQPIKSIKIINTISRRGSSVSSLSTPRK